MLIRASRFYFSVFYFSFNFNFSLHLVTFLVLFFLCERFDGVDDNTINCHYHSLAITLHKRYKIATTI